MVRDRSFSLAKKGPARLDWARKCPRTLPGRVVGPTRFDLSAVEWCVPASKPCRSRNTIETYILQHLIYSTYQQRYLLITNFFLFSIDPDLSFNPVCVDPKLYNECLIRGAFLYVQRMKSCIWMNILEISKKGM